MNRWRQLALALVAATTLPVAGLADAAVRPPNIVVILADDIGYGDLGCYGATKVKTPHLDRLAREGMRFTDAYAPSSVCSPTRYALLTGKYSWRGPIKGGVLDGDGGATIKPGEFTLAQVLKGAGYATACIGKWHLGLGDPKPDWNGEIKPGPNEIGFDYSFIIPATPDRVPCVFVENGRVVDLDPNDPIRISYHEQVGAEPTGLDHPEMLKLRADRQHSGTIVAGISRIGFMSGGQKARWIDENMGDVLTAKTVDYIAKNRERPFFVYLATHNIHVPRAPNPRYWGRSDCGVRGEVIMELDDSVGAVMAALERLKLVDNTLVIFSSDNGGMNDDGYQEGGLCALNGHRYNGPYRGVKSSLWEGGSRVPFLARWPQKIQPGVSAALTCLADLPATAAAVVGAPIPVGAAKDSCDLLPVLTGAASATSRRDFLYLSGNGRLAIRQGDWKLIPELKDAAGWYEPGALPGEKLTGPGLYNLAADPGETRNLAAAMPEKVIELKTRLQSVRQSPR